MKPIMSREFKLLHNSESIAYSIYFNSNPSEISCVLALGSGQVARLPEMVAACLKVKAAVIQGLPHWQAQSDGSDLEEFTLGFASQSISKSASQVESKISLIAESQAVPGAVSFALNNPEFINSIILVQPLGLNTKSYTESKLSIVEEFEKRVRENTKFQITSLLSDWRLIYNHYLLFKTKLTPDFRSKFATHYKIGLQSDISTSLRKVAKQIPIHVILGENDRIFPPDEVIGTIEEEKIELASLSVVRGVPHSPLVSRSGRKLMDKVETLIKSK